MRNLAQRLVCAEIRPGDPADTEGRAAFRVCEKLRVSLSVLLGARGFRTLIARALTLSKAKTAWLGRLEVAPNGTLVLPGELEGELKPQEMAEGGAVLVGQVLDLLVTFIGEALTQRLVQQVWPAAAPDDSKSGGKQ